MSISKVVLIFYFVFIFLYIFYILNISFCFGWFVFYSYFPSNLALFTAYVNWLKWKAYIFLHVLVVLRDKREQTWTSGQFRGLAKACARLTKKSKGFFCVLKLSCRPVATPLNTEHTGPEASTSYRNSTFRFSSSVALHRQERKKCIHANLRANYCK